MNLKNARNSFVHEGVAKIGQIPVLEAKAKELLAKANETISFIKSKLPLDLQWPEYKYSINLKAVKKIL